MNEPCRLAPAEALSPGLIVSGRGQKQETAYELKFLLWEGQARQVERWAVNHLLADPHGEAALGGAYRVSSLYLDTAGLDVFRRVGRLARRKLRLRGYGGSSGPLFVEQKTRRGDRVRKRRSPVAEADLPRLALPAAEEPGWPGAWFQARVIAAGLRPTFQVGCVRRAFLGPAGAGEPMRLTLDRHLWAVPNAEWRLLPWQGGLPFLSGQVVLELKFCGALPLPFKLLLEEAALNPCPVSKYRLGARAWGAGGEIHEVG